MRSTALYVDSESELMKLDMRLGDCLDVLPTLEAGSVHCCVTSPPYWGLRDYGTATWKGGDTECDHVDLEYYAEGKTEDEPEIPLPADRSKAVHYRGTCKRCGATQTDSQLGLEATPEEYVAKMVEVFRAVRRVLRDDGTLWLNLGDCYNSSPSNHGLTASCESSDRRGNGEKRRARNIAGLKPKDLVGFPWRVAFALQEDGWWLRSDIIWHKPSPMPEAVKDRPTRAHEYLFLLSKSRKYYYDADAISEPVTGGAHPRGHGVNPKAKSSPKDQARGERGEKTAASLGRSPGWRSRQNPSFSASVNDLVMRRNKRSVWTVAQEPFKESHFATFPTKLVSPCILAGCPKGGLVLDPFAGAGTTGLVADRLERNAVLIELNPEYCDMAKRRIESDAPLFAEVSK